MNTLVGMMKAEEVGMVKKTIVGKNYGITAGEQFQIKVGDSSLILNADGSIVLKGNSILIQAEKDNTLIGNDVHINPEEKNNTEKENIQEAAVIIDQPNSKASPIFTGNTVGFDEEQRKLIDKVRENVKNKLLQTQQSLNEWTDTDIADFKKVFGNFSDAKSLEKARNLILRRVNSMIDLESKLTINNFTNITGKTVVNIGGIDYAARIVGANVVPSDRKNNINIGRAFFISNSTGLAQSLQEQTRQIIHEISHFQNLGNELATYDFFGKMKSENFYYGVDRSKELASKSPKDAIKHADSFSYYASRQTYLY